MKINKYISTETFQNFSSLSSIFKICLLFIFIWNFYINIVIAYNLLYIYIYIYIIYIIEYILYIVYYIYLIYLIYRERDCLVLILNEFFIFICHLLLFVDQLKYYRKILLKITFNINLFSYLSILIFLIPIVPMDNLVECCFKI